MRIKDTAILWDMDGTIIDTKECHFNSWRDALRQHGLSLDREIFDGKLRTQHTYHSAHLHGI